MLDTVWVALIAVAGTLGSGTLSYLGARKSTAVQLTGVEVELQRLKRSSSDEAREERLSVYLAFLNALEEAEERFRFPTGISSSEHTERATAVGKAYNRVVLLGTQPVVAKAEDVVGAVVKFSEACAAALEEDPKRSDADCHKIAAEKTMGAWTAARNALREAMGEDLERYAI